MITPRRLAVALLAALLLPTPLRAGDDAPGTGAAAGGGAKSPAEPQTPEQAYQDRLAKSAAAIASKFEAAGSFALGSKLRLTALDAFKAALDFDPDARRARAELGWARKGDEWVKDEKKLKALENYGDLEEKQRPQYDRKFKDAQVEAAKTLAELGALAEAAGKSDRAEEHYRRALEMDDQNRAANEKLGNVLVEGKWRTRRAIQHQEFLKAFNAALAKARKVETAVVEATVTTGYCEKANISVKRFRSPNFLIESDLPAADIKEALLSLERARVFFCDFYQIPERLVDFSANPSPEIVVTDKRKFEAVIDSCGEFTEGERSFKKKFSGIDLGGGRVAMLIADDGATAEREVVHQKAHLMVGVTLGSHAPWLREAVCNTIASSLKDTDLKVCFSGQGSTAGIHLERIAPSGAPRLLWKIASDREPKRRKLIELDGLIPLPSDGMTALQIAKAWSVVMFLLEKDRAQTREWVARAGTGPEGEASKDATVLAQVFTDYKTWAALDADWTAWALDVYRGAK